MWSLHLRIQDLKLGRRHSKIGICNVNAKFSGTSPLEPIRIRYLEISSLYINSFSKIETYTHTHIHTADCIDFVLESYPLQIASDFYSLDRRLHGQRNRTLVRHWTNKYNYTYSRLRRSCMEEIKSTSRCPTNLSSALEPIPGTQHLHGTTQSLSETIYIIYPLCIVCMYDKLFKLESGLDIAMVESDCDGIFCLGIWSRIGCEVG